MRVFYADDDPEDCQLFEEALQQVDPDLKPIIAKDGKQALGLLNNMPEPPDYIFLDINIRLSTGKNASLKSRRIRASMQYR